MVGDENIISYEEIIQTMSKESIKKLLNSSSGKDIVVFIGGTGSGRSTIINYLSGHQLVVNDMDEIVLKNPLDGEALKIGSDRSNSETTLPQFQRSEDFLFYDLPGFCDTRGITQNLLNACFIKNIIENARTVRFLLVFSQDSYTAQKQEIFKKQYEFIQNLIPDQIINEISSVLMTKTNKGDSRQDIIRKVIRNDKNLCPYVDDGRFAIFPIPSNGQVSLEDKKDIIEIIRKTIAIEIKTINIDVIYSDRTHNQLIEIFSQEIITATMNQINNKYYDYDSSELSIVELQTIKKYFDDTFLDEYPQFLLRQPLIALLRGISESQYQSSLKDYNVRRYIVMNIAHTKSDITQAIFEAEASANASWWIYFKKCFNGIELVFQDFFGCGGQRNTPNPKTISDLRELSKQAWDTKFGQAQRGIQRYHLFSISIGGVVQHALNQQPQTVNNSFPEVRDSIETQPVSFK